MDKSSRETLPQIIICISKLSTLANAYTLSRTASSKCKGYLKSPSRGLVEENSNLHAWEVVESEF